MKKVYLTFTIICLISLESVQAQLEKGKIMVGVASTLNKQIYNSELAMFGFTSNQYSSSSGEVYDPSKITTFSVIPSAGYFIIDNLATGLNLFLSYNKDKTGNYFYNVTNFQICAVPYLRYYYPLEKLYPFVELNGGLGINRLKTETSSYDNQVKWGVTMFGGGVGVALPVVERVTLDVMAFYSNVIYKRDLQGETSKEIYGSFGVKLGFMVYLGL